MGSDHSRVRENMYIVRDLKFIITKAQEMLNICSQTSDDPWVIETAMLLSLSGSC